MYLRKVHNGKKKKKKEGYFRTWNLSCAKALSIRI